MEEQRSNCREDAAHRRPTAVGRSDALLLASILLVLIALHVYLLWRRLF